MLSKSGPVDLLTVTRMLQQIQEKYGNILEHISYVNMGIKNVDVFEKVCPRYHVFRFLMFLFVCGIWNTYFKNNCVEMRIEK